MLQIKNINKKYKTGELVQTALDGVSLTFRDNEFVAVLGPSGSGKTTLLNIIGGLDRYDSGDLIINGVSTKEYNDHDWDSYRNHTIGFVFQSYNLIPHQSVLANVELALTISGISRTERRRRAKEALEKVGLGDQLHKKPNQMSGGQMQRVAIARALVNDPDILLADEPTGALDSETGLSVMGLLKEVATDRLVVMVTHNGELAERYANRIVKLRDGKIKDDSNPFESTEDIAEPVYRNMGRAKMTFLTSLSLSFNNLKTKKGRTFLTSFAGSIGIIGIALILALSTGVNDYIADLQKDTMTSYPITLTSRALNLDSVMGIRGQMIGSLNDEDDDRYESGYVYADNSAMEMKNQMMSSVTENDLSAFKAYLDDENSEIKQYIGENGVVYSYDVKFSVYSYDKDGNLVSSDADADEAAGNKSQSAMGQGGMGTMNMFFGAQSSGAENFKELMRGTDGNAVSAVVTDTYDVVYGTWCGAYDETVLVLDKHNSIPSSVMYQLGLITSDEYKDISDRINAGETPDEIRFDFADILNHEFYLIPACDSYIDNGDGTFSQPEMLGDEFIDDALKLKIVGIVRPTGEDSAMESTANVFYTSSLTDYVIEHTNNSAVVLAQENTPETNVLTGMSFEPAGDDEKVSDAKAYISALNISNKAALFKMIMMSKPELSDAAQMQAAQTGVMPDESTMAAMLDRWLAGEPDAEILISIYDNYTAGGSYEDNLASFGKVSYEAPSSIGIYTDSFEDKEAVQQCILDYNKTVNEDKQITYTDYVALLTSSLTSMVDVVSYILIAFVAVSLVVSCIMIGIITHISVLERTKEIGILRALGASKRNVSEVFNAETFIIGMCAGLLGVLISSLLTIPINALLAALLEAGEVAAKLPVHYAAALVIISIIITVIGGLIPSRKAANMDPVIALRTE